MEETMALKVLVVDDEESLQFTLKELIAMEGHEVRTCGTGREALRVASEWHPAVVITDYSMPGMNGIELLERLRATDPDMFVIMMTAYGSEEIAVEAMKKGAFDYFVKPFSNKDLLRRIARAEELSKRQGRVERGEGLLVWRSPQMEKVMRTVERVADTDVTVLLLGESGTGKELVAMALHAGSSRRRKPMVKLNCAALPESLIESELFGYEEGAFTGAGKRRKGKFEQADGGTIFLDEIGDMTPATQTKVLRVLQDKVIERLGSARSVKVDVRVIAATHQNLEEKIAKGEFRHDLYYRINVVTIHLPPLREREGDVELLADHFLELYSRKYGKKGLQIPSFVMEEMLAYHWPGNVRELENAIARAVVMERFDTIVPTLASRGGGSVAVAASPTVEEQAASAASAVHQREGSASSPPCAGMMEEGAESGPDGEAFLSSLMGLPYREAKERLLDLFERRYFSRLLEEAGGNVSEVARRARMHRKNVWEKLLRRGLVEGRSSKPSEDGGEPDGGSHREEGDD